MGWIDIYRKFFVDALVRSGEISYTPEKAATLAPGSWGLTPAEQEWFEVHRQRYVDWRGRVLFVVGAGAAGLGIGYIVGRYTGVATQLWWNTPWIGGRAVTSFVIGLDAPDPYTAMVATGAYNIAQIGGEVAGAWAQARAYARDVVIPAVTGGISSYHGYMLTAQTFGLIGAVRGAGRSLWSGPYGALFPWPWW